jgi:hypothetical protein
MGSLFLDDEVFQHCTCHKWLERYATSLVAFLVDGPILNPVVVQGGNGNHLNATAANEAVHHKEGDGHSHFVVPGQYAVLKLWTWQHSVDSNNTMVYMWGQPIYASVEVAITCHTAYVVQ